MKSFKQFMIVFSIGAVIYSFIEIIFRGFTHWTMSVTGGFTLVALYLTNLKLKTQSLILRCFVGSIIITSIEFVVGCIVNRGLNLNVWDYSDEKFNVLGQICPLFTVFWFLLCIPAAGISYILRRSFAAEK